MISKPDHVIPDWQARLPDPESPRKEQPIPMRSRIGVRDDLLEMGFEIIQRSPKSLLTEY
jgi:hypothetical protein